MHSYLHKVLINIKTFIKKIYVKCSCMCCNTIDVDEIIVDEIINEIEELIEDLTEK